MKFNKLLLILLLASCSIQTHKPAIEQPVPNTPTVTVPVTGNVPPVPVTTADEVHLVGSNVPVIAVPVEMQRYKIELTWTVSYVPAVAQ